jgi:hypothetical protein
MENKYRTIKFEFVSDSGYWTRSVFKHPPNLSIRLVFRRAKFRKLWFVTMTCLIFSGYDIIMKRFFFGNYLNSSRKLPNYALGIPTKRNWFFVDSLRPKADRWNFRNKSQFQFLSIWIIKILTLLNYATLLQYLIIIYLWRNREEKVKLEKVKKNSLVKWIYFLRSWWVIVGFLKYLSLQGISRDLEVLVHSGYQNQSGDSMFLRQFTADCDFFIDPFGSPYTSGFTFF